MIDDEKIIELFFERSEQGIRELDNKYGAICHNLSYNIVNNRQDAEEYASGAGDSLGRSDTGTDSEPCDFRMVSIFETIAEREINFCVLIELRGLSGNR